MTPEELLIDLADRGIVLNALENQLRFHPKSAITPELLGVMRQHKDQLIHLLRGPTRWNQYDDAIARAFANPIAREKIGPRWMTNPEGWDDYSPDVPMRACSLSIHDKQVPGVCDRCGSTEYKDVSIHEGRSIRRDCAHCGRTLEFVRWQPE